MELNAKSKFWIDELELAVFNGHNASVLIKVLPAFYEALSVPDREARTLRLQTRAISLLMKDKQFVQALTLLRGLPERQLKLEAACYEGISDFRAAATCYLANGNAKEALSCYRLIPDLEEALKLIPQAQDHPAAESLRWMADMQQLVSKRPEKFTKLVTPAEKKLLEDMLERALGVTRKKPAPRKVAASTRTIVKQKTPLVRKPVKFKDDNNPYF